MPIASPQKPADGLTATRTVERYVEELTEIDRQAKALALAKKKAIAKIRAYMNGADELYNSRGEKLIITDYAYERIALDVASLRKAHPRIVARFERIETSHRFLIK